MKFIELGRLVGRLRPKGQQILCYHAEARWVDFVAGELRSAGSAIHDLRGGRIEDFSLEHGSAIARVRADRGQIRSENSGG